MSFKQVVYPGVLRSCFMDQTVATEYLPTAAYWHPNCMILDTGLPPFSETSFVPIAVFGELGKQTSKHQESTAHRRNFRKMLTGDLSPLLEVLLVNRSGRLLTT